MTQFERLLASMAAVCGVGAFLLQLLMWRHQVRQQAVPSIPANALTSNLSMAQRLRRGIYWGFLSMSISIIANIFGCGLGWFFMQSIEGKLRYAFGGGVAGLFAAGIFSIILGFTSDRYFWEDMIGIPLTGAALGAIMSMIHETGLAYSSIAVLGVSASTALGVASGARTTEVKRTKGALLGMVGTTTCLFTTVVVLQLMLNLVAIYLLPTQTPIKPDDYSQLVTANFRMLLIELIVCATFGLSIGGLFGASPSVVSFPSLKTPKT